MVEDQIVTNNQKILEEVIEVIEETIEIIEIIETIETIENIIDQIEMMIMMVIKKEMAEEIIIEGEIIHIIITMMVPLKRNKIINKVKTIMEEEEDINVIIRIMADQTIVTEKGTPIKVEINLAMADKKKIIITMITTVGKIIVMATINRLIFLTNLTNKLKSKKKLKKIK